MADPTGWEQAERLEREEAGGQIMFIVAQGPRTGQIGTAQELVGETVLAEGSVYDPTEFPQLAELLKPLYGDYRVPSLSGTAEWL